MLFKNNIKADNLHENTKTNLNSKLTVLSITLLVICRIRVAILSLFKRFVLFLKVRVLKNFVVLIFKKCTYFEPAFLCLMFTINVRNHIETITISSFQLLLKSIFL